MPADQLSTAEAAELGKRCRNYGNPIIGAFAAELIGASYPLSEVMAKLVLNGWEDEKLGRRFAQWLDGVDR